MRMCVIHPLQTGKWKWRAALLTVRLRYRCYSHILTQNTICATWEVRWWRYSQSSGERCKLKTESFICLDNRKQWSISLIICNRIFKIFCPHAGLYRSELNPCWIAPHRTSGVICIVSQPYKSHHILNVSDRRHGIDHWHNSWDKTTWPGL